MAVQRHLGENCGTFIATALGSREGTVEVGISKMPSMTSLFNRVFDDDNSKVVETRTVQIQRLDRLISELINDETATLHPILLKIDTEGYEMEVLRGSEGILDTIDYIILEIPLAKHVHGAYSFADMIAYMDEKGFTVLNLRIV